MTDDELLEITASLSNPSTHDDILVHIVRAIDQATDKQAAIDDLVAAYPGMTQQVREFLEVRGLAEGLRTEEVRNERHSSLDTTHFESLGEYRIVRRITRGGMGEIYEAYHELLRRRVAVKVIRPDKASPDARRRFAQEQRVLARLHQTHIVSIYSAGREGEVQYFVMPFIEGATLQQLNNDAKRLISARDDVPPLPTQVRLRQLQVSPADARLTPREQIRLTEGYVRSIAEAMRELSNAVHEAHEQGIVHRDLKTSNVMIDVKGHAWLIDFGLATLDGQYEPAIDVESPLHDDEEPLTQGPVGTPPYMAPEQFDQHSDRRTDVWGLGVMLYQLLTLRPPFESDALSELESLIRTAAPISPAQLVSGLAPDLQAICLKALAKSPVQRYQTALDFSEDLRHWLRHEPTAARPLTAIQRARLWSRRNRGWAAALFTGLVAVVALGVTLLLSALSEAAFQAQEAAQKTQQALILRAQRAQSYPRVAGWSTRSWSELQRIEGGISREEVQPIAANALAGLDAVPAKQFEQLRVDTATWDAAGRRLLMNSGNAVYQWSADTDQTAQLASSHGPIAFTDDSTPVQLRFIDESNTLVLVELNSGASLQTFSLPDGQRLLTSAFKKLDGGEVHVVIPPTISGDGKIVAVLTGDTKPQNRLIAWNGSSGKLLQSIELATGQITAIALCADLAALGHGNGTISVWSLSTGERITTLSAFAHAITSLEFARDYVRLSQSGPSMLPYLLAAGDEGGTAVVWDLQRQWRSAHEEVPNKESAEQAEAKGHLRNVARGVPRAICHGGEFAVQSVHFSPDASTLAVASLGVTQLWDTSTGRHLLDLGVGTRYHLARFSNDGTRLLLSNQETRTSDIWELTYGRAIQRLRGLRGQVFCVVWSSDGRRIAAVSNDRTIGVWDAKGTLEHVLPLESVFSADNAAIAFNKDGTLLAACSGERADLWDLTSGQLQQSWPVRLGIGDLLAFPSESQLFLARNEFADKQFVYVLRNLLAKDPHGSVAEFRDFPLGVFDAAMARDGSRIVIDGLRSNQPWLRSIRAYDHDGATIFTLPIEKRDRYGALALDATDHVLAMQVADGTEWELVEVKSGKRIGRERGQLRAMALGGKKRLKGLSDSGDQSGANRLGLLTEGTGSPDVSLELGRHVTTPRAFAFNKDGTQAAWGNRDGTVMLCDWVELQRRLAKLGLGW